MKLFVFIISAGLIGLSSEFLPQDKKTQQKLKIFINELVKSRSIDTSYFLNSMQNVS